MISRTESSLEMILLLKGLAKATAAAANKVRATRHRTASIFIIQQINTFFVSATEIRSGAEAYKDIYGVVDVEERRSVSFNSSSGRSSSEIRPPRGVSMSVIIAMTMATRTGKTNRSRIECRPEVPAW